MVGCRIHHGMTGGIYCHDDVSTWSSVEWAVVFEGPQQVFRDPGFPLFEGRDSGFLSKMGIRFGIDRDAGCGMRDAENNHRDYRIERKFGSG